MGGCCPDKDENAVGRWIGWLCLYFLVAFSVFMLTSWLLPKLDEAQMKPTPKIRVSPPQEHEFHSSPRVDPDRG